jgi:hypothetical protein
MACPRSPLERIVGGHSRELRDRSLAIDHTVDDQLRQKRACNDGAGREQDAHRAIKHCNAPKGSVRRNW